MSRTVSGFIVGVIVTIGVIAVAGYIGVTQGFVPANADAPTPGLERWASSRSLRATFRKVPRAQNPLPANDANLIAGIRLYGQNCAVCHGDASGTATQIAAGMYVRAPQLAKDGVEDDPDQITYWKIAHGYRWTGMPSFGAALSSTQMWQLTAFLKNMDHLPPAAERVWRQVRAIGTKAPPQLQPREQQ